MTEAPTRPGALPALLLAVLGGSVLIVPLLLNGSGSVASVDTLWRNWGAANLGSIWSGAIAGEYAPVAALSAWLDHRWASGADLLRWAHLHSMLVHLLTGVLFLGLLRGLGAGVLLTVGGGLAFLLHPAAHETAALIGLRPAMVALLFGLSALLMVQSRGIWIPLALLSISGAVLADWRAVVLPVVAVVWAWARVREGVEGSRGPVATGVLLLPPALVAAGLCVWMQGGLPALNLGRAVDPLWGALLPRSPGFVFAGDHGAPFGIATLVGIALLALAVARRRPGLSVGLAMVFVGCLAAVGWTPGAADFPRYVVVAGLVCTLISLPLPRPAVAIAAVAVALVSAVVSVQRAPRLQDGVALWEEAAASRPVAAVRMAEQLASSSLVDSRRRSLRLLEDALLEVETRPLRLEVLELASRVHSKLGETVAASQRAEAACALAEELHRSTPAAVDDARLLAIYLRTVECFNVEDSRKQIDRYFDRARALAPEHPEVLAGDGERLYVALVHALRREAKNPQLDLKPGWLPAEEPRLAEVEAKLVAALAKDPACYRALVLKGRIAEAQGGLLSAVPFYQQASAARPERVEAHILLATLYVTNELPEAAEECVRGALQQGLDDPALHYLLGNIYAVQGRRDDARRYLEAYVLNRPDNRDAKALLANLLSAEALSKADQLELPALTKMATRIRELNADDPKGWMVQAAVLAKSRPRQFVDAIVLLEKAQEKMPGSLDVRRQLAAAHRDYGWALVLQKRRDRAMDHFVKFLSMATRDQRKEAVRNAVLAHGKTLERDGRTQMRNGKAAAAESAFRRATELTPKRAESFYQLGIACFHQKKLAPARAALEQALALSRAAEDGSATVYALPLVDVLLRLGDRVEAQKVADQILATPGDAAPETLARLRAMLK